MLFFVCSLLIQAGADVNAIDNDSWTALHAASHWGHKEAAEILAEALADMDLKNKLVSVGTHSNHVSFKGASCFLLTTV